MQFFVSIDIFSEYEEVLRRPKFTRSDREIDAILSALRGKGVWIRPDAPVPRDLERCRQRVSVEVPRELRRHPDAARMTWLAAFVHLRAGTLTDDMVDLLIDTVHRIGARAERKVEKELLEDQLPELRLCPRTHIDAYLGTQDPLLQMY
jgi:hypothetical protein